MAVGGAQRATVDRSCSALSVYFSGDKPAQSFQDLAKLEDVYSDGCNDHEEEGRDGSFIYGARFADQQSADHVRACAKITLG